MAKIRKQSTVARAGAPASTADGLIGELQRRADEIMALLSLFGNALHSHRRAAVCGTCPAWGSGEIGTLEDRAATRLMAAGKRAARQLRSRKPSKGAECFKELEGAADECMVLLDLFGSSVIQYRRGIRKIGEAHNGTNGLAIIFYSGMDRLKTALEALRKPLGDS